MPRQLSALTSEIVEKMEEVVVELAENVKRYPATPYTTNSLENLNLALNATKTAIEIERLQDD